MCSWIFTFSSCSRCLISLQCGQRAASPAANALGSAWPCSVGWPVVRPEQVPWAPGRHQAAGPLLPRAWLLRASPRRQPAGPPRTAHWAASALAAAVLPAGLPQSCRVPSWRSREAACHCAGGGGGRCGDSTALLRSPLPPFIPAWNALSSKGTLLQGAHGVTPQRPQRGFRDLRLPTRPGPGAHGQRLHVTAQPPLLQAVCGWRPARARRAPGGQWRGCRRPTGHRGAPSRAPCSPDTVWVPDPVPPCAPWTRPHSRARTSFISFIAISRALPLWFPLSSHKTPSSHSLLP